MVEQTKKLVPEIRFKGFSDAWEKSRLGELADVVRGASPRPIKDPKWFDCNSSVGWLRISDVTEQGGRIHYLEQRISKAGEEKTRVLTEPHLLLSIAASVGKPVINYVQTGVHDGFLIFKDPVFDQEFMFQWMKMFEGEWHKYGQPGSQVNLNSDIIKSQNISLPKSKEQIKIGDFLYKLDQMIGLHQRKHEKLMSLKKAMLKKMFPQDGATTPEVRVKGFSEPWEEKKLEDLGVIVTGSTPSTQNLFFYNATGIPWVTPTDIIDNVTFSTNKHLSEEGKKVARVVPKNTILVTCIASIGKNTLLSREGSFNQQINGITPFEENDPYFTYTLSVFWSELMKSTAASGTMQIVNKKEFSAIKTKTPHFVEQKKIGTYFRQLDELIAQHGAQLTKLKQIKNACLEKMFV